jgi:serine/threonine protein kinase
LIITIEIRRYKVIKVKTKGNESTWICEDTQTKLNPRKISITKILCYTNTEFDHYVNNILALDVTDSNPNFIQIEEIFMESMGEYYNLCIVTPYYDAGTLARHIRKVRNKGLRLSQETILNFVEQLSFALMHLHR